jgi:predicted Zn-dependent protease with MMP-like domain
VGCPRSELLGLYEGVPLSKRTHQYGLVMPDKISLFRGNIERACRTKKAMKRAIRHTVQHELAHHFGIDDDRLEDLGIY